MWSYQIKNKKILTSKIVFVRNSNKKIATLKNQNLRGSKMLIISKQNNLPAGLFRLNDAINLITKCKFNKTVETSKHVNIISTFSNSIQGYQIDCESISNI